MDTPGYTQRKVSDCLCHAKGDTITKKITKTVNITIPLKVKFEKDEDGWWVAQGVKLKGALTQGKTLKSAIKNTKEAHQLFIEVLIEDYRKQDNLRKKEWRINKAKKS